ncbi:MAG: GAF domain-containing protein [Chloroflexia bacterium]|nr:GAF domain-containing protein [Chloroflexia bacterium]
MERDPWAKAPEMARRLEQVVRRRLFWGLAAVLLLLLALSTVTLLRVQALDGAQSLRGWLWAVPALLTAALLMLAYMIYRSMAAPLRWVTDQALAYEIGQSLSVDAALEQVTQALYAQIAPLFKTGTLYIALYDEPHGEWETILDIVKGEPQPKMRHRVDKGLTGYLIRQGRPLLFHKPEELQRFFQEHDLAVIGDQPQSWIGVPMLKGERVVGAIGMEDYERSQAFSERDLGILLNVAGRAAAALENALRYEESIRRGQDLDKLFRLGIALVSELDLPAVLNAVCREAVNLLQVTSAYVCAWDEARGETTVQAEFFGPEASERERISDLGEIYPEQEHLGQWLHFDKPYMARLSDSKLTAHERQEMEKYDAKSILYLPLAARGHVFGYLEIWESRYERAFDRDEILLGQNLANQAAIAIENARLLQAIRETVDELSAATAEILSATSQQATGATEQSAAITAAAGTIDELGTIAGQATERAQEVADLAEQTATVSQAGRRAVADAVVGITDLRNMVTSIAADIRNLAEQARTIDSIIAAVDEIATQSNLLALNAAVEAARAGPAGRGFAVVAQEVRDLAAQSQSATEEVQQILLQIYARVEEAVQASLEGVAGADAGVDLSGRADSSIEILANSVSESSQAARQITASVEQQQSGLEQLSQAMFHIRQVTEQGLRSAQQVEGAAEKLHEMTSRLQELVVRRVKEDQD